ncbi:MAG: hypothetical protein J6334_03500 [Kiritimatiellae bacterium]|nr:hypothetical protein [Kiritimatiellia bacterium]
MANFDHELGAINSKVNRWRAFERLIFVIAGSLLVWCALTALDVWLRPRLIGRLVLCAVLAVGVIGGLVWVVRLLGRRRSPAAVAALLEKHFPQLDNRLINCVLFGREKEQTAWLRTYLKEGVPGFAGLPLAEMKNRTHRKYGAIAAGVALLLLLVPAFILGDAWTIALRRVANPFCRLSPPTFAKVLAVMPENKTIVQGDGIDLKIKVSGRAGQFVDVDLYPADDKRTTMRIGQIQSTGAEELFTYRVAKVATALDYRFTVGDAYPTDKYKISTVPPLALASMQMVVTPPAYTGLRPQTFQALTNAISLPVNAKVAFQVACNRPVESARLVFEEGELPLTASGDRVQWTGEKAIDRGTFFNVAAKDQYGLELHIPVRYQLIEDRAPAIRLLAPTGKAVLPANAAPAIRFEVSDEYGLGTVRLERVNKGAKATAEGELLMEWKPDGKKTLSEKWNGSLEDVSQAHALRLVAYDNAEGTPHKTVGQQIVFEMASLSSQVTSETKERGAVRKSIGELVARQRTLLKTTTKLEGQLPTFDQQLWQEACDQQGEIKKYAQQLQKTKDGVIGTARVALGKALEGPLPDAVMRLTRMTTGQAEARGDNAKGAIEAQNKVLRLLAQAGDNMAKGEVSQAAAGVLAMLDGIRKGQTANLNATKKAAEAKAETLSEAVVERQDNLAQDVQAMIGYCRSEAKADREDEEFGKLMAKIADQTEALKVHPDMVDIAEVMDSENYPRSVGTQQGVTNNLTTLIAMLNEWREAETKEKTEDMLGTIQDARSALKKMEDLQTKIVDALRGTGSQGDKTEKLDEDLLEEIVELKKNMAQAMLKVATDLQALPELDAVNELVTDTFQTYEEMAQKEGSGTNAVTEVGLQKEDWILEALAKTGEKADEMEMWLKAESDNLKRNMETFDKEEMAAPIGQVTMPEELQDIIGDLLESEEEQQKNADDSVTNQGDANVDAGWDISEGEFVDYNASGKSGNDRPDHKDQDGRSQVGRQGMSDGEVMARSGRINEGDNNLDKRRTQDSNQSGDVEEEGHSDAVATGGGKNSGYSQDRGMEGGEGASRRDTKVSATDKESTRSQLTRNAEAAYAQAQLNNLKTYDLKKYIAFSRKIEMLEKQNASPAMIEELHKKAIKALTSTYASLENGISSADMGAASETESDEEGVAASPDEAPAEYREMVSDYFKAIGELK